MQSDPIDYRTLHHQRLDRQEKTIPTGCSSLVYSFFSVFNLMLEVLSLVTVKQGLIGLSRIVFIGHPLCLLVIVSGLSLKVVIVP